MSLNFATEKFPIGEAKYKILEVSKMDKQLLSMIENSDEDVGDNLQDLEEISNQLMQQPLQDILEPEDDYASELNQEILKTPLNVLMEQPMFQSVKQGMNKFVEDLEQQIINQPLKYLMKKQLKDLMEQLTQKEEKSSKKESIKDITRNFFQRLV